MPARTAKPKPTPSNDELSSEQKKEILADPKLRSELLNSKEGKEAIASVVDPEEITKIIEEKVAERVGQQAAYIPESQKRYTSILVGDNPRHRKIVEI